jgi:diadenosine tetraphosphate (Ap4A) HIT family hydrolase
MEELTEEQLECLRGCNEYLYYFKMRERFESRVCAFCHPEVFNNEILFENEGWTVWKVPQGYSSYGEVLATQLVYFPRRHIRHLNALTEAERTSFWKVIDWIYERYEIPGGAFFVRVGDMRYNVGTVPHLHFNLFVPNRTGEVNIPLQKDPATWEAHEKQMQEFARRYAAGERP